MSCVVRFLILVIGYSAALPVILAAQTEYPNAESRIAEVRKLGISLRKHYDIYYREDKADTLTKERRYFALLDSSIVEDNIELGYLYSRATYNKHDQKILDSTTTVIYRYGYLFDSIKRTWKVVDTSFSKDYRRGMLISKADTQISIIAEYHFDKNGNLEELPDNPVQTTIDSVSRIKIAKTYEAGSLDDSDVTYYDSLWRKVYMEWNSKNERHYIFLDHSMPHHLTSLHIVLYPGGRGYISRSNYDSILRCDTDSSWSSSSNRIKIEVYCYDSASTPLSLIADGHESKYFSEWSADNSTYKHGVYVDGKLDWLKIDHYEYDLWKKRKKK
jgi:hypothetical protein